MSKIKLCGLSRECDIEAVNELKPEYIGFILTSGFRRSVPVERVIELRKHLSEGIRVVGVFVDEPVEKIAELLNAGVIDLAQLHGKEDNAYIDRLRKLANTTIIKAFKLNNQEDIDLVNACAADYVLLDSGTGCGQVFDWNLIHDIKLPFFLAGGLHPGNVADAIKKVNPYAVDVSSGIETDGYKDREKMTEFVRTVRKGE